MPQMAPISWLILFIIFSLSFITFNVLNFYCFNNKFTSNETVSKPSLLNNPLNWKW